MATPDEIKILIGKIGSDATLLNQLLGQHDQNATKAVLVRNGLVKANETGITQQDALKVITDLMQSSAGPAVPVKPGERAVEWVAALATAAAGAAAGACTADV